MKGRPVETLWTEIISTHMRQFGANARYTSAPSYTSEVSSVRSVPIPCQNINYFETAGLSKFLSS